MSESIQEVLNNYHQNEYGKLELITELWTIIIYNRNFSSGEFDETLEEIRVSYPTIYNDLIDEFDQESLKNANEAITEDEFEDELVQLKNNFALERIENLKRLGKKVYSFNESQHSVVSEMAEGQPEVIKVDVKSEEKTVGEHLENLKHFVKAHKKEIAGVGAALVGVAAVAVSTKNGGLSRPDKQNQKKKQSKKRRVR